MSKKRRDSHSGGLAGVVTDLISRIISKKDDSPPSVPYLIERVPVRKGKCGLKYESYSNLMIPNIGFGDVWRSFAFRIPFSSYIAYKSKPRLMDNRDDKFWRYVTPYDIVVNVIASTLRREFFYHGIEGKEAKAAQLALDFVHIFPYSKKDSKDVTVPCYVKYPVETLFEFGGNCVDLSVLYASLLTNFSIDCCLVCTKDHALVGVAVRTEGHYIEYNGRKYYLAETAGTDVPWNPSAAGIGEACIEDTDLIEGIHSKEGISFTHPSPSHRLHLPVRNIH